MLISQTDGRGLTVLSLFDGIGCGRVALEKAGFTVSRYFASETDRYAVRTALYNYPDMVQIGDVKKVFYKGGILYSEKGSLWQKLTA